MKNAYKYLLFALGAVLFVFCTPPKKAGSTSGNKPPVKNPPSGKPKYEPMDTIKWSPNPSGKPPIGSNGQNPTPGDVGGGDEGGDFSGQRFKIALLLPFLTNQVQDSAGIPEKSRLGVQFYAGAKLALEQLSTEEGMNLVVDVFDTQSSDADFERVMSNPKVEKAEVCIGPIRSSHVTALARKTKMSRQILISPESPNMELTSGNPNFIQLNPSLKTHCEAIARHVRAHHAPENVVLVCRQKESERLAWLQNAGGASGGRFAELVVPDATENFNSTDLSGYFRAGKTTVFVMPSFSNQDFVFAFLRKVKAAKGKNRVEIYGLPQWESFENIEPEFFSATNVHISKATWVNLNDPNVKAFREKFYATYGTLPDDDAFNGYDATLFAGKMLKKYGLDFPARSTKEEMMGLHARFRLGKVSSSGTSDSNFERYDYLENKYVYILKFENFRFTPTE